MTRLATDRELAVELAQTIALPPRFAEAGPAVAAAFRLGIKDRVLHRSDFRRRQWAADDPRRDAYQTGRFLAACSLRDIGGTSC